MNSLILSGFVLIFSMVWFVGSILQFCSGINESVDHYQKKSICMGQEIDRQNDLLRVLYRERQIKITDHKQKGLIMAHKKARE